MTESMDSHLLMSLQSAGSADPMTIDLKLVECVLSAATACVDNAALLGKIADEAKDAAGGYPQLSAEYVVTAEPDLIVLADTKCCKQSPATVAKRPAFAALPAVKDGRVLGVDDDIASRWGPRTADFAEAVAKALAPTS